MKKREEYQKILKGLRDRGFLADDAKYELMWTEILKLNEDQLKGLKKKYYKLKKNKIKNEEDYKRFLEFVLTSSNLRS